MPNNQSPVDVIQEEARAREVLREIVGDKMRNDAKVDFDTAIRAMLAFQSEAPAQGEGSPVAWRTEYRDVYKGHDTGWHFCYSDTEPHPTPLTSDGCGHRNKTPLYARLPSHPLPGREAIAREAKELRIVLDYIVQMTETEPDEHPVSLATRLLPIWQAAREALKAPSTADAILALSPTPSAGHDSPETTKDPL